MVADSRIVMRYIYSRKASMVKITTTIYKLKKRGRTTGLRTT